MNVEIVKTPEISPTKINPFFKIKFDELHFKYKPLNPIKPTLPIDLFASIIPQKDLIENSLYAMDLI